MKLTSIVENPSLKNIQRGKYRYSLRFKGDRKPHVYTGHMDLVHALIKGLLEKGMMSEEDISATRAAGSYLLTVEVTDCKDDEEIKSLLHKSGLKTRYSVKHKVNFNNQVFIVCREWTAKRVDKLITATKDFCTVERLESPENTDIDEVDTYVE